MRSQFDKQLALLNKEMIEMGSLCEEAISLAAKALFEYNANLAKDLKDTDEEIDHMERSIESVCLKLLLQQQPVAGDLRQISAALKMITDLERIGDQAEDIAEIVSCLDSHSVENCQEIGKMADAAIEMVSKSIDAYVKQDVALAESVIAQDDLVDDYFDKVNTSLIAMITQNPSKGKYALDLLMIAKYFERIGDHATNIAEWVVFSVTGIHKGECEL